MSTKLKANLLIAVSVLATVFVLLSTPLIDERCDSCGEREDSLGLAAPLRKLTIIEWMLDTTIDLHINGKCPTEYWRKHSG